LALKPDAVQRGLIGEVISRFERKGFKLVGLKMLWPTEAQAKGHYDDLKAMKFFGDLVTFFSSGPIVAMVWEGENVILTCRKMMGETRPKDSAPGTIRGDYALTVDRNIIHGSDKPESAVREIEFWFGSETLCDYTPVSASQVYPQ